MTCAHHDTLVLAQVAIESSPPPQSHEHHPTSARVDRGPGDEQDRTLDQDYK
jgi:hypothetical protein